MGGYSFVSMVLKAIVSISEISSAQDLVFAVWELVGVPAESKDVPLRSPTKV